MPAHACMCVCVCVCVLVGGGIDSNSMGQNGNSSPSCVLTGFCARVPACAFV